MKRPDYLNSESNEPVARSIPVDQYQADTGSNAVAPDAQKVLRNTYALLAMTLVFSAVVAGISMMFNAPHPGLLITVVGFYGLLFAIEKTKNSAMGLMFTFALTGFMGYTLGPILSMYAQLPNGSALIGTSLGATGLIFLAMSGWVLTTGKDLSNMGKTLMVGMIVALVMMVASIFLNIPALSLAVSALFIILMSAMIAYQTSAIIHGGETNYISAAVTLYVSIYNLFLSLLQILGVFGSDD
ncbi:MAG: Bax inhibitor-1/YccA family protein [Thalassolituus maritimus]|uniref:Modulator of FtsH protease n=1 Tax=Thalassolituus maritimus TaxID=484498 RepID=A0A1N7KP09_9GAMM|nr:Bax inhibitor-1/YccA family protein [Thalassolituus maritimus]TPD55286.1 MAG: Bax inhibitor-1/YccA family protein [Thalassolituus maritimus]SIS63287.1 modulator of FtsH protease [Thalassolituus maritimus]